MTLVLWLDYARDGRDEDARPRLFRIKLISKSAQPCHAQATKKPSQSRQWALYQMWPYGPGDDLLS